ncbi:MAG: SlyX family protein [Phycisphaerales bacterium]|nr:SlyX family protein [Phycisphaerales bacterium]
MSDQESRIRRVEETLAFSQHESEALSDQVVEAFRRLDGVMARLERIERRIESLAVRLEEGEDADERPEADDGDERRLPGDA